MAESSPVSDSQTLLHSMLQRLKLQTQAERTHNQEQAPTPAANLNGGSGEGSAVYQFGDSIDSKEQGGSPSIWRNLGSPWSHQTSHRPLSKPSAKDQSSGTSPTSLDTVSLPNDDDLPKWKRKQLKKVSDDSCSTFSTTTTEQTTLNSPSPSIPLPTPPVSGRRASQDHSGINSEGVGDTRRGDLNVEDKMTRTSTTRTSKKKWDNSGQKRWTQKVKERWKERHKKERGVKQKEEPNEAPNSNHPPNTPANLNTSSETAPTITTALIEEERSDQLQPINKVPEEDPPSPLDHMSEPIFSFGSFNLMEEIFTSQEWARFFPSSTSSHSEDTCLKQDQATDSQSSISQSHEGEQTTKSLWDFTWPSVSDLRMYPSQTGSESAQQEMDTSDHTNTSDFSLPFSPTFQFLKNQSELFDSSLDQPQSMELSLSRPENEKQPKYQPQLLDIHQNCQPTTTKAIVQESPSNQQTLNQAQPPEPNHSKPGEDVTPFLDLSYLQKNSGSHGTLSRKRGHGTLSRSSSDRVRSGNDAVDRGSDTSIIPLYSLHPAPNLSPASSISSLQYSISQESQSSLSTETVVKKRRLEDTRHVRFAEEVIYIPAPILYEGEDEYEGEDKNENGGQDEDEDENNYYDNDDYDDDDDDDDNDDDTDDKGDINCNEELQSRLSVPKWMMALRTKTKRKSKFKLPQMPSTPTMFKSSKLFF